MLQKMYPEFVDGRGAVGLLTARLIAGYAFVIHGWPKIQAPASWLGYETNVPGVFQSAAAITEFVGGIFLILGVATPIAAAGIATTMLSAITIYHWSEGHPYIAQLGQVSSELAASYLGIMVALVLVGPGTLSLDWMIMRGMRLDPEPSGLPISPTAAGQPA